MHKITSIIEYQWTTEAGKPACIKLIYKDNQISHRCGYIETELHDANVVDSFHVHGGVTFNAIMSEPFDHAIGFDCMHAWDNTIESDFRHVSDGEVRSLNYCIAECEKLATQVVAAEQSFII